MLKKIKEVLKELYLKISCNMCCRSKCSVEVGSKKDNNKK
jgi:hypothetical protein